MKTALTLMMAFAFSFLGCKNIPSADKVAATATAVGKAAGYVANMTKIDDKSRAVVIEIVQTASRVVPGKDQTFVDAWTPIADELIEKLVKEGKIDKSQSALIKGAFTVACKGLDYLVDVRFPKVREYENLMSAAVKSFSDGFLEVFKPSNGKVAAPANGDYDKEAYDFLLAEKAITK